METSPCCNSVTGHQIATHFCTYHDSSAVVPCTIFCSDHYITVEMRVKRNFHRILNCDGKTVSETSLGSWWGKSTGHQWAPLKWSAMWSFSTSFAVSLITLRDKQSECQWYWMPWSLDAVVIMWLLPTRTSRTQRVAKIRSVQKIPCVMTVRLKMVSCACTFLLPRFEETSMRNELRFNFRTTFTAVMPR